MLRAVLFDVDGTLLDSNDIHALAWLDALRGHGVNVPLDAIRRRIGMGGDKLLREVANMDSESPEGKALAAQRVALIKGHYAGDLAAFDGARALVQECRRRYAIAVVSSAKGAEVLDLLRQAGVANLFSHIISSDDADNSKPDPDLVQVALARLGVGASEAMFIGDTPYDVIAARRTGVPVIAVRCGGWSDKDLKGALAIYDGPRQLFAQFEASPLGRKAAA